MRVSELVALERNHVQMLEDEFIVFVGCSKTDQFGNGSSIRIPKTPDSFLMFQIFQKVIGNAFKQHIYLPTAILNH